ncbi:unnamed protein product [Phaeothamnion confervicola]
MRAREEREMRAREELERRALFKMKRRLGIIATLVILPVRGATIIRRPEILPPLLTNVNGDVHELAPTCSYGPLSALTPDRTLVSQWPLEPTTFPRTKNHPAPLYAGLQMWESRGAMTVRRAAMAMLGDLTVFYETPLFTAYRLLALGRTFETHDYVYHSLGCGGFNEDWLIDGYGDFFNMVSFRAYDPAERERFPRAESEAEAAAIAKMLVDDFFDMSPEDFRLRFIIDDEGGTEGRALKVTLNPLLLLW